jgi:hypothetical protein
MKPVLEVLAERGQLQFRQLLAVSRLGLLPQHRQPQTITGNSVSAALGRPAEQAVECLTVIAPQRTAAEALAALPRDLPVVAVESGSAPDRPVVYVDQKSGAAAANSICSISATRRSGTSPLVCRSDPSHGVAALNEPWTRDQQRTAWAIRFGGTAPAASNVPRGVVKLPWPLRVDGSRHGNHMPDIVPFC